MYNKQTWSALSNIGPTHTAILFVSVYSYCVASVHKTRATPSSTHSYVCVYTCISVRMHAMDVASRHSGQRPELFPANSWTLTYTGESNRGFLLNKVEPAHWKLTHNNHKNKDLRLTLPATKQAVLHSKNLLFQGQRQFDFPIFHSVFSLLYCHAFN